MTKPRKATPQDVARVKEIQRAARAQDEQTDDDTAARVADETGTPSSEDES